MNKFFTAFIAVLLLTISFASADDVTLVCKKNANDTSGQPTVTCQDTIIGKYCDIYNNTASCETCNTPPPNSTFTGSGYNNAGSCPWECILPFVKDGGSCRCPDGYREVSGSCVGKNITINWNFNDGTAAAGSVTPVNCTYGGDLDFPDTPTQDGKVFEHWRTANSDTTKNTYAAGVTLSEGCVDVHLGSDSGNSGISDNKITAIWGACASTAGTNGELYFEVNNNKCEYYILCNKGYYLRRTDSNGKPVGHSPTATVGDENLSCIPCPKGYYCPGSNDQNHGAPPPQTNCASALGQNDYDGRCKCPIGATSDGDASAATECYITKDTLFCDNHGCFNLPITGTTKIKYKGQ
jgi:hypothetical protein